MDHLFIHHELQRGEYGFAHFVMDYLKTNEWISTNFAVRMGYGQRRTH